LAKLDRDTPVKLTVHDGSLNQHFSTT